MEPIRQRRVLVPGVLDLNAEVEALVPRLREFIGPRVRVEVRLAPAAGRLWADPVHLEQVVFNLAANAQDAMPEGGTLTIETFPAVASAPPDGGAEEDRGGAMWTVRSFGMGPDPERRRCVFSVADTGEGIAPGDLAPISRQHGYPRVSEPFSTTRGSEYPGLGLSHVIGIVVGGYGGHLMIESALGLGTVVRIYWPEATPEDLEREAHSTSPWR